MGSISTTPLLECVGSLLEMPIPRSEEMPQLVKCSVYKLEDPSSVL